MSDDPAAQFPSDCYTIRRPDLWIIEGNISWMPGPEVKIPLVRVDRGALLLVIVLLIVLSLASDVLSKLDSQNLEGGEMDNAYTVYGKFTPTTSLHCGPSNQILGRLSAGKAFRFVQNHGSNDLH
jgi:hypothetical protein